MPFVAVPAGTLNHLARDLGLETVDDAIAAVRAGTATRMDLGVAGDRCFVNTLTFGGYSQVVDARERLEDRIGKWPALLVALVRELPRMEPLRVELDGEVAAGVARVDRQLPLRPHRLRPVVARAPRRRAARRPHRERRPPVLPHPLHRRRARRPAAPAAPSTRRRRSSRCRSVRSTGRCAWPPTARPTTDPTELEVTKRRQALRVAVPPDPERSNARPEHHQQPGQHHARRPR